MANGVVEKGINPICLDRNGSTVTSDTYSYDGTGQLSRITTTDGSGTATTDLHLDANGNTDASGTSLHGFNELHDDGTYTYGYDSSGNRISKAADSSADGAANFTQYDYDVLNRLISVTEMTAQTSGQTLGQVYYNYDVFGQLVGTTVIHYDNGIAGTPVVTANIWDNGQILARVSLSGSTTGEITRSNVGLPGSDQLMSSEFLNADGTTYTTVLPLFDHEGSINDLYTNGQIGQSVTFDAFGILTSLTTNTLSSVDQNAAIAAFGFYYDSLSGAALKQMQQDLATYTSAFDAKYGTSLFQSMVNDGFPGR